MSTRHVDGAVGQRMDQRVQAAAYRLTPIDLVTELQGLSARRAGGQRSLVQSS